MKFNILLTIIFSFLLYSCSEILPEEGKYPYDFKNQLVQGEFNGESFLYKSGHAETGSQLMVINLYDIPKYDTIKRPPLKDTIITIHDTIIEATYGSKLKIEVPIDLEVHDLIEWNTRVIYYEREGITEHMTDGAVQNIRIDADSLVGQIDVIAGTKTFFNGNFRVPLK